MSRVNAFNFTVPACNYSTESLFASVPLACGDYISSLQTCPASSVPIADRLLAADQTATCMRAFWQRSWLNDRLSIAANFTNETAVAITAKPDCTFPDFLPILQKTCAFDLERFDGTCSSTFNETGLPRSDFYTNCQSEAAVQYVRCTLQKRPDEVEDCVASNAVKVDWLPQIQGYDGAKTCPNVDVFLVTQGLSILRHVVGALMSILLFPKVHRWLVPILLHLRQRLSRKPRDAARALDASELRDLGKPTSQHSEAPIRGGNDANAKGFGHSDVDDPDQRYVLFNPWKLEKRYTLKATRLLQTVGRELLTAVLTVIVLHQSGYRSADNTFDTSFNEEISFYAVRPRPAPFLGLLGLFVGWSQKGLAELVVDGMLSFVAGTNVATKYFYLVNQVPPNPAAPATDLKNLAIGAIMTCIPAFAVLAITFLISLAITSDSSKDKKKKSDSDGLAHLIAAFCVWSLWLTAIAIFICLLPFIAIVEMLAATVLTIRRSLKQRKTTALQEQQQRIAAMAGEAPGDGRYIYDKNKHQGPMAVWNSGDEDQAWPNVIRRSRWEEPLTTESGKFRVLYALFVLSSFVINIGNWLFFANYLKLSGELYCPSEITKLMAIWILVPFAVDLFFYVFRVWTNDTVIDGFLSRMQEVPPPM